MTSSKKRLLLVTDRLLSKVDDPDVITSSHHKILPTNSLNYFRIVTQKRLEIMTSQIWRLWRFDLIRVSTSVDLLLLKEDFFNLLKWVSSSSDLYHHLIFFRSLSSEHPTIFNLFMWFVWMKKVLSSIYLNYQMMDKNIFFVSTLHYLHQLMNSLHLQLDSLRLDLTNTSHSNFNQKFFHQLSTDI